MVEVAVRVHSRGRLLQRDVVKKGATDFPKAFESVKFYSIDLKLKNSIGHMKFTQHYSIFFFFVSIATVFIVFITT